MVIVLTLDYFKFETCDIATTLRLENGSERSSVDNNCIIIYYD